MVTERKVLVRLQANVSDFVAGMGTAAAAVRGLTNEINTSNDRTTWLAQSILGLGPALVPFGAAAVPVLAGVTTQLTLMLGATGTAVLAFAGMGDGLKALNAYQLEPTTANLEKMQQAMEKLGPDGEHLTRFLDQVGPQFSDLQMVARAGIFPGVEEGITSFLDLMPKVKSITAEVSTAMGELAADAGAGLSGEGFADFFDYLEHTAKPMLLEMGHTFGNFAEGFGAMIVAFDPLAQDFSGGMLNMSESFAGWAHGLKDSSTFEEFVAYIEHAIPLVTDFLGSFSDAVVAVLTAAAPVGDLLLPAFTMLLDVIGALAETPLGPLFIGAAAAMSIYGRAVALASITTGGLGKVLFNTALGGDRLKAQLITGIPSLRQFGSAAAFAAFSTATLNKTVQSGTGIASTSAAAALKNREAVKGFGKAIGPAAGAAGLMAFAMSDLDDKMGLTNATMGAMVGMIGGPWGAGIGAAIGLGFDLAAANNSMKDSITAAYDALDDGNFDEATLKLEALRAKIVETDEQLQGSGFFSMDKAGQVMAGVTELFGNGRDEMVAAAEDIDAALRDAGVSTEYGTDSLASLGTSAFAASTEVRDLAAELVRLNNILEGRASWRDYQAAIDDATKAAKENGETLDRHTKKGRDNEAALDNIAATALKIADRLKGMDKLRFLSAARKDFVQAATDMGMGEKKAEALADRLLKLDGVHASPDIVVDPGPANADITAVQNRLDQMRDAYVTIHTIHANDPGRDMGDGTEGSGGGKGGDGAGGNGRVVTTPTPVGGKTASVVDPGGSRAMVITSVPATYARTRGRNSGIGHAASASVGDAPSEARRLAIALREAEAAVKRESAQRDRLIAKRDAVVSGIAGGLTQDIWSTTGTPWSGGTAMDPTAANNAVTREAKEFTRLLRELKDRGLTGAALAEAIGTGDIERLRFLDSLSRKDLIAYQRSYNRAQAAIATASQAGGNQTYGPQVAKQTAELRAANKELREIKKAIKAKEKADDKSRKHAADRQGQRVNSAASRGVRSRPNG